MFAGRKLVIATMHGKEEILGPLLEKELGVEVYVPEGLNTDDFGTFSGEVERQASPLNTARTKASTALQQTGYDLAIASEGSFGPHPIIGFVPADEEWLLLLDQKNNLEIVVREISTHTNFNARHCHTPEEVKEFAREAGFPEHGLILRKKESDNSFIYKGIQSEEKLIQIANDLLHQYQSLYIETDMRSMMNPMRREVIATAAKKLVDKLNSCCPSCNTPGFDVEDRTAGLPCSSCHLPTRSVKTHIYKCRTCGYTLKKEFPNGKLTEDPMYCDYCNP
jgi:hypothetical protein